METLFLLAVVALLATLLIRRDRRNWARLRQMVDALSRGRQPPPTHFPDASRYARVGRQLESIGQHQHALRTRTADESAHLQAILASMAEGLLVVDRAHTIRLVNRSVLDFFGVTTSPLGQTVLAATREAAVEEVLETAIRTGEKQSREFSLFHPQPRHLMINAVPLRNAQNAIDGAVAVLHDTTQQRRVEEMRKAFVANVSHELRTPLSIFRGYLENLLDAPDMPLEDRVRALETMERHGLRLNALLEDLLTLARLESRRDELEYEPIDLRKFLEAFAADWQLKAAGRLLEVEVGEGIPPLNADEFRLEQVLGNLLENAIKFTPEGGRIVLGAEADADSIRIRVSDTGEGIPAEDLPHIFERFYRVDKARTRERGGTGLGLSIVKHIVGLHGGSVEARSVLGQGTTILLRFPRVA